MNSENSPSRPLTLNSALHPSAESDNTLAAPHVYEYAGFWRRALAGKTDDLIVAITSLLILAAYSCGFNIFLHFLPRFLGLDWSSQMLESAHINLWFIPVIPFWLAFGWCYWAALESSPLEATPGQRLFNLKVLASKGNHLTFWHASRKLFVPAFLLSIALLLLAIGASFCLININFIFLPSMVLALLLVLAACFGDLVFLNRKKQTLHDLLAGRITIKSVKADSLKSKAPLARSHLERGLILSIPSLLAIIVLEGLILSYCNVDLGANVSPSAKILNKSGYVWITPKRLSAGSTVDLKTCRKMVLPIFRTPPFALDSNVLDGKILVLANLNADSILTYRAVAPSPIGISNIISIEPLSEKTFRIAGPAFKEGPTDMYWQAFRKKFPTFGSIVGNLFRSSAPEKLDKDIDEIERATEAAGSANKQKSYPQALIYANEAIRLLKLRYQKFLAKSSGVKPEQAVAIDRFELAVSASKALPENLNLGLILPAYRAAVIDNLIERAIAQAGLNHRTKADIDAANCFRLLKSLQEKFVAARKKELNSVESFHGESKEFRTEGQTEKTEAAQKTADKYLNMLGNADEKRYQEFVQHIKTVLKL